MRWFVEISGPKSAGGTRSGGAATEAELVVEAKAWQGALKAARELQGEVGPISQFSIELLPDGYRAVDPRSKARFMIKRAPDDAPLSTKMPAAKPVAEVVAPEAAKPEPPKAETPAPPSQRPEGEAPRGVASSGRVVAASNLNAQRKLDRNHPLMATQRSASRVYIPTCEQFLQREEDPSDQSPLTYREYAYVVPAGTTESAVSKLIMSKFREVVATLTDVTGGKFVNLAIFDVRFASTPPRPPLATLSWKDWRGPEPEIRFPAKEQAVAKGTADSTRFKKAAPRVSVSTPPASADGPPPTELEPVPAAPAPPSETDPDEVPTAAKPLTGQVAPPPEAEVSQPLTPARVVTLSDAPPEEKQPAPAKEEAAPATKEKPKAAEAEEVEIVAEPPEAGDSVEVVFDDDEDGALPDAPPVEIAAKTPESAEEAPESTDKSPSATSPVAVSVAGPKLAAAGALGKADRPLARTLDVDDGASLSTAAPKPIISIEEPEKESAKSPLADSMVPPPRAEAATISATPAARRSGAPPVIEEQPSEEAKAPTSTPKQEAAEKPEAAKDEGAVSTANTDPAPAEDDQTILGEDLAPPTVVEPPPSDIAAHPALAPAPLGGMADVDLNIQEDPAESSSEAGGDQLLDLDIETDPQPPRRLSGIDLLGDLFETMHELVFFENSIKGAYFVLEQAVSKIPSKTAICHFYDMRHHRFVVVATLGEFKKSIITSPMDLSDPLVVQTMKTRKALMINHVDASSDVLTGDRWQALDEAPKALLTAPILMGPRYVGMLELAGPTDAPDYMDGDAYALAYIGEQMADFLSQRGAIIDPAIIRTFQPEKA